MSSWVSSSRAYIPALPSTYLGEILHLFIIVWIDNLTRTLKLVPSLRAGHSYRFFLHFSYSFWRFWWAFNFLGQEEAVWIFHRWSSCSCNSRYGWRWREKRLGMDLYHWRTHHRISCSGFVPDCPRLSGHSELLDTGRTYVHIDQVLIIGSNFESTGAFVVHRLQSDQQFSAGGENFKMDYVWQCLRDPKTYIASERIHFFCFEMVLKSLSGNIYGVVRRPRQIIIISI